MLLPAIVLALALRLSSRSPTGITQHTLEAFSVFQYCPGVHEISLDFETTQHALHRVKAVVHMTTKAPLAGTPQTNTTVTVVGTATTVERATDVCSASALCAVTTARSRGSARESGV